MRTRLFLDTRLIWVFGALILAFAIACITQVQAHDEWANGNPVPSWVKASCCGPEDVHHLKPEQVHTMPDGWHVDGYKDVIAYGRELDSQDGDYWIFYKNFPDGSQTPVYCFFAPKRGS